MVSPDLELPRLRELLPASGRMKTRIKIDERQSQLIATDFPKPWKTRHTISLNLSLWGKLTVPQRDLLFLRQVCWLTSVNLLQPDWYRGLVVIGAIGTVMQLLQQDVVGLLAAGGLTAVAGTQVWRQVRGSRAEVTADEAALQVAQRRGYSETEAAQALLQAIEAVPRLEGRSSLTFTELLRCQHLRSLIGVSPVPVPEQAYDG